MLFEIGVISGLATQEPRLDYSRWRNNCSWFFVALRKTGVMEEVESLITTIGLVMVGRLKGTNSFFVAIVGEPSPIVGWTTGWEMVASWVVVG